MLSQLIPLVAFATLLAACQGTDRPLAPSLDQRSSDDDGLKGRIVFHSGHDGDIAQILVMNADGTDQTHLTHSADYKFDHIWSPNGKRIAYLSFAAINGNQQIFVMNADGTGITPLTDDKSQNGQSAWSPDGKQIAFHSNRDGTDDLYIMNADGSNVRRVTTNAFVAVVCSWSPNGKQIAISSYRDYILYGGSGDLEIFFVNTDGTGMTQITDNNDDDAGDHASWSPDGKLFTFSRRAGNAFGGGKYNIFVMNADGTHARQLTGLGGDASVNDTSVWSPNGKRIAFNSTRDGDEEVYTMKLDGSDLRNTRATTPRPVGHHGRPTQARTKETDGEHALRYGESSAELVPNSAERAREANPTDPPLRPIPPDDVADLTDFS